MAEHPKKWKERIVEPEIIDDPDALGERQLIEVLSDLARVNRWLGGTASCLKVVGPLLEKLARRNAPGPVRIVDWGTGGGDIPASLIRWSRQREIPLRITAIDFNQKACRHARRVLSHFPEIDFVAADVSNPPFLQPGFELALFSAFLHHFEDAEVVAILKRARSMGIRYAVINDLHRSRWALAGFELASRLFSRSPTVRQDGALSVRKGFRRAELKRLARAVAPGVVPRWHWAFRYTMVIPLAADAGSESEE